MSWSETVRYNVFVRVEKKKEHVMCLEHFIEEKNGVRLFTVWGTIHHTSNVNWHKIILFLTMESYLIYVVYCLSFC